MNDDQKARESKTKDEIPTDDLRDLKASEQRRKRISGPTFDIMSDEEIEDASARILAMIDDVDDRTEDSQ